MPITINYTNSARAELTHDEFLNSLSIAAAQRNYRFSVAKWTMVLAIAIFLSAKCEFFLLLAVLVYLLVTFLMRSVHHIRTTRTPLASTIRPTSSPTIQLTFDEDGLHETTAKIQSFAPWSALVSFTIYHQFLFIELANDQWAVIPSGKDDPDVERIIQTLLAHNIKQWPAGIPHDQHTKAQGESTPA